MLGFEAIQELVNVNITIYKGAIYKNAVADSLIKRQKELYYFSKSSGLEIDFITTYKGKLTALEVTSNDGRAK